MGAKEVIQPFTAVAAVLAEGETVVHAIAIKTNASEVLEYGEMISVPLHAEDDGEPVELAFAKALAPLVDSADCIGIDGYKQPDTPSVLAELFGKPVLYDFDNGDLSLGGSGGGVEDFFVQALGKMVLSDGGLFGVLRLSSKIRLVVCDCSVDSSPTDGSLQAFDIGAGWRNDVWQGPTPSRFQMRMIPKRYVSEANRTEVADDWVDLLREELVQAFGQFGRRFDQVAVFGPERQVGVVEELLVAYPVIRTPLPLAAFDPAAIAYCAARNLKSLPTSCRYTTGVAAPVGGAEIVRPKNG